MSGIREKLNKARQSSDAKTVASNFAWLTVLQVAGYVFPLITLPYLARVIGVDGFSKIAFATAIMIWIQTVADWGFNMSATRDVAQNRDDPDKVSRIFSNVLWARLLLMLVSCNVSGQIYWELKFLPNFLQSLVGCFHSLVNTVSFLGLCYVNTPIQYWKDII